MGDVVPIAKAVAEAIAAIAREEWKLTVDQVEMDLPPEDYPEDYESRHEKDAQNAAQRLLGCTLDAVPRTLLGRDIAEMDLPTVKDWMVLMSFFSRLFYSEEDRRQLGMSFFVQPR
jgi:hypothetical protein